MKKNKVFALVLSLALVACLGLPGTLALSTDADAGSAELLSSPEPAVAVEEPAEAPVEEPVDTPEEHLEGCLEGCAVEGCQCACHQLSLFERLMACATLYEAEELIMACTQEELDALSEEEVLQITEHLDSLEPEPLPAVEPMDIPEDVTVPSEVVYPTVNYSYVAPFAPPVTGGES